MSSSRYDVGLLGFGSTDGMDETTDEGFGGKDSRLSLKVTGCSSGASPSSEGARSYTGVDERSCDSTFNGGDDCSGGGDGVCSRGCGVGERLGDGKTRFADAT